MISLHDIKLTLNWPFHPDHKRNVTTSMPQVEAKESKVLISVIIPVYNVRTFLPELFENLKGQNLTHTEVLFIDDGSADGSSEELDRLAKGTDFIVIHQENSGVAAARNHALDIAHGEYLCFIDPDDRISINYLQVLKQVAHDNHPDLIITDWRKVVNGVQQPLYLAPIDFPQFPTTQLVLTEILSSGRIIGSLWAKLFSAKLFQDNRFPIQRTSSDYASVLSAICKAHHICYAPGIFYAYTADRATSLQNNQKPQDIRDSAQVHEKTAQLIRKEYPALANLLRIDLLNSAQQACIHICRSRAIKSDERKALFRHYRKPIMHDLIYLMKRSGSLKYKMIMLCIAVGYYPTYFMLHISAAKQR